MRINNLELTDFRNYNHFFIEFDQGINILIGGNAQGKTNIIEAIYLLSVCKSFRTHINDQMIQFDHDFAKVKGNVFSNERMHQLELILSKESKKAKVDGKDILKISDYVGYLNAVVFVPDDLSLVKGSPSIRRKFLDLELSKISPIYVFYLTKYNRLLKERNQYLKLLNQRRGKYDEYLETLDEQLAEVQIKIIEKRNNFIERLSLKVKDIYLNIANCHEIVELQYECFIKNVNKEDILKKNINELAKLSYTSSATISRLCKKLGFNGYKEFKYQYAAEYSHLLELKNDFKIEPFSSESSIDDALNKIELLHKRAIEYTKSLLDKQVIERIYQLIKNAKYIEIYGTGINFSLAEIYSLNFEEEGVISKAYNSLNPMHLQYLRQRKPNDTVCIYLTHTGQNMEMLKIAKDIRKYHAKSIVICDHKKREICKYCDETIVIMTTQNTTELSNAVYIASLQYVFNIFTSLKLISNYSYLEETTKAVDKFKMGE